MDLVKQEIQACPHTSIRRVMNATGLSYGTVWRIARANFHPYKMQTMQQLLPTDHASRLLFANSVIERLDNESDFIDTVIFSDEAHFHLHGGVNTHNVRYWAAENPNWVAEKPLHSPRVTVWAALGKIGIIGPFSLMEL